MIYTILQKATEDHDICAAFTQGNHQGHIYLETTMSRKTMDLLHITPGILHMNQRIYTNVIPLEDWSATLILPQRGNENLQKGQWVRVLRGTYRNDIGWIKGQKPDRQFIVLLISCVVLTDTCGRKHQK